MVRASHILALKTWVELALGLSSPSPSVVFLAARAATSSGAAAPRRPKPYVTLRVTGELDEEGDPYKETTDTAINATQYAHNIYAFKAGRVSVTVYGDDHDELIQSIEDSIQRPSIQNHFDSAGVLVTRSGGTAAAYSLSSIDTRLEDRSERVFVFRRTRVTNDAVEVIEELAATQA